MKLQSFLIASLALCLIAQISLATTDTQYNCTMINKTGWPTAFYLGGGDVINLQSRDSVVFPCEDLKGVSKRTIRSEGVVANQLKSLDRRTLTLHYLGNNHYSVTSDQKPYPH